MLSLEFGIEHDGYCISQSILRKLFVIRWAITQFLSHCPQIVMPQVIGFSVQEFTNDYISFHTNLSAFYMYIPCGFENPYLRDLEEKKSTRWRSCWKASWRPFCAKASLNWVSWNFWLQRRGFLLQLQWGILGKAPRWERGDAESRGFRDAARPCIFDLSGGIWGSATPRNG